MNAKRANALAVTNQISCVQNYDHLALKSAAVKYCGPQKAYYANTSATFQLKLLIAGDVKPNILGQKTYNCEW